MKRVQRVGHSSSVLADAFIGEERELTVDLSNNEIRAHDGITPGGFAALRVDAGNLRDAEDFRDAIGASAIGQSLFTAVNADAVFTAVGMSAIGKALVVAANSAAVRTQAGITAIGSTIVTAVDAAAVRTGIGLGTIATQDANNIAITGGTITGVAATITSGTITGITALAVADGGTGASTAANARTNLGLGTIATQAANNVAITGGSVAGIADLAVADGGTGASDAAGARTNLSAAVKGANNDITSLTALQTLEATYATNAPMATFTHAGGALTTSLIREIVAIASGSGFNYLHCSSNSGGDTDIYIRGDGQVISDASFSGGGADYAELYEWADGNRNNEDRTGKSVVLLEGTDVIRLASENDDARSIIGVVSGRPSVVGNNPTNWPQKYLTDVFGRYVLRDGAKVLNPDFNKNLTYTTRAERAEQHKEWAFVGLLGQLVLHKNTPKKSNWIKQGEINSQFERWLVR